ncbi:hypothetical protein RB195_015164 [Necator americanus]|uniref:Fibronectin type-III domain-containing protein n=1 Tax=Necator americanus TaxID=51031 RepID=A0ABR1E3B2_NECAM
MGMRAPAMSLSDVVPDMLARLLFRPLTTILTLLISIITTFTISGSEDYIPRREYTRTIVYKKPITVEMRCPQWKKDNQTYWIYRRKKPPNIRISSDQNETITRHFNHYFDGAYECILRENGKEIPVATYESYYADRGPGKDMMMDMLSISVTLVETRQRHLHLRWNFSVDASRNYTYKIKILRNKYTEHKWEESITLDIADKVGSEKHYVGNEEAFYRVVADILHHQSYVPAEQRFYLEIGVYQDLHMSAINEVTLKNLRYEVIGNRVVLHWRTLGLRKNENIMYSVRVLPEDGSQTVFTTLNNTIALGKMGRPSTTHVTVEATSDGAALSHAKIEIVLKKEAPRFYPTSLEATVISPTEIYIDFEPLAMEEIPGEDAGCTVYVCKRRIVSPQCSTKRVPPRVGESLFTELEQGATFYATATCSSDGGEGPESPWIIFEVPRVIPKDQKTDKPSGKTRPTVGLYPCGQEKS